MFRTGLIVVIAALAALPVFAGEPEDAPEALQKKISELVARLGAEEWSEREKASEGLVEIGRDALPALEKAAKSPDPEVRLRAQAALSKIRAKAAEAAPGTDPAEARPREKVPFPPPAPFGRDLAEIIKKLMDNPFAPDDRRWDGFERDLEERLRRMFEGFDRGDRDHDEWEREFDERFRREMGGALGEQKSTVTRGDVTAEVTRKPDGAISVKLTTRTADGEPSEEIKEFASLRELREKDPELYENFVKEALSRARVRVVPGFGGAGDLERMVEELQKEFAERVKAPREPGRGRNRAAIVNRIVINQNGEELRIEVGADGSLALTVRERGEDGKLEEKQFEAASEQDFKEKYPEAFEKYLKGKLSFGGGGFSFGFGRRPAPRQEPGEGERPLGIIQQKVSDVLRVHLGLEEGVGFVVKSLEPGSIAAEGGLEKWDLVFEAGNSPVTSTLDLLAALKRDGKVELKVIRRGEKIAVTLKR